MITQSAAFTISRSFEAPRDKVWDAWTHNDLLKVWFGPKGCPIFASTLELKVGGVYHYGLKTPDVGEMWGKWVFREIEKPSRLVWDLSFTDAEGHNTVRHPYCETWPLDMTTTLVFAEQDGKTTLTLSMVAVNANEIERKTFEEGMVSLEQGWGGTLEQLTEFLARR